MNTTLTEISNIFNLMVQADSRLKFYHFGWRSDINKNIDNNFDKGVKTGRLFPALHFDVPDFFQPSEELNYLGFKEDIQINLYFDDLQNYDNSGEQKTDTLIEQWADLKQITEDFISNLSEVLQYYKAGFIRTVPRFEPKSNLFNDRLITFEVSFTLSHFSKCTEELYKIDLLSLPAACFPSYDIENYLKDLECKSLDLDGVNGYIEASGSAAFDLEITDSFSFAFWHEDFSGTFKPLASKIGGGKGYRFLRDTGGQLLVQLINSASQFIYVRTINPTPAGWVHYTVTYNGVGDASGIKIYYNGIEQTTTMVQNNFPIGGTMLTTQNFLIAAQLPTLFAPGKTAAVRAWNLELNSTEVFEEYSFRAEGCIIKQSNLIGAPNYKAGTFDGLNWSFPDIAGNSVFNSVNLEENDLLDECP